MWKVLNDAGQTKVIETDAGTLTYEDAKREAIRKLEDTLRPFSIRLDEVKRDVLLTAGTPLSNSLGTLFLMWSGSTPAWSYSTPILYDVMAIAFVLEPKLCPVQPTNIVIPPDIYLAMKSADQSRFGPRPAWDVPR